jgi:hypothetical protein
MLWSWDTDFSKQGLGEKKNNLCFIKEPQGSLLPLFNFTLDQDFIQEHIKQEKKDVVVPCSLWTRSQLGTRKYKQSLFK